ncbi:hypothetical protein DEO72_LG2g4345 [Vigna unguiculata]|uniref:Uncharacterized protein n=1 Tax=Vigna unguiculata TaxID=3917 RepID=A0A4D6L692_VIGUN|nr:hypothetical protein DEO72_LG2g4345 [Vigna unguiculata]
MEEKDASGSGKKEHGNTSDSADIILREIFGAFLEQERKENPQFFSSLDNMEDSEILASIRRSQARREEGRAMKEHGNATDSVDIILREIFGAFLEQERKENPQFFSSLDNMEDSEILASIRRSQAKRKEAMAMEDQPHCERTRPSEEKSKNQKNLK